MVQGQKLELGAKSRMTSKLRPPGFFRKTDLIANLPRQGPFAPDDEWAWPTAPPSPLQKDGR